MTIVFTVTNDLSYDQRMHRICRTLAENGYQVCLVGRSLPHSIPLTDRPFRQKRLRCFFRKGFLFYKEYNLRLLWFLLFARYDAVCSADLDTLVAGWLATVIRRKKRVFDAHEYFTEVPELVGRPLVKNAWEMIARICLPFYKYAYTVGPALAAIFQKKYGLPFEVVRNVQPTAMPVSENSGTSLDISALPKPGLLYMGALNEGRGIETAIEAMRHLERLHLWIAGEGDLSEALRRQTEASGLGEKVTFLGYVSPGEMRVLAENAWLGLNLLENRGLSYYYSLANKFFASVQAGVPVLTMNFPEYRAHNEQFEVALLLDQLTVDAVVEAIRRLRSDASLYQRLQQNCILARREWNWEHEAPRLLDIWEQVRRDG
ncbi:MAG: glycosyltransferase [Saprospiraceae bacterium]